MLQINVGRARAAHDAANAVAEKMHVDILLFQEPNRRGAEFNEWVIDENVDVAVCVGHKKFG